MEDEEQEHCDKEGEMRRVLMILMIKRIILIMGIMKMIGKTGTLF